MDTASKTRNRPPYTPYLPDSAESGRGRHTFADDVPLGPDPDGNEPPIGALAMHALAVELRSFMNAHGLTQMDVAAATGIPQGTVSRILHGTVTISVEILLRLEAGLEVKLWQPTTPAAGQRWDEARAGAVAVTEVHTPTPAQARAQVLSKIGVA